MKTRPLTRAQPNETQDEYHNRMQREQHDTTQTNTGEQAFQREVTTRLRRIETRVVAGLEELGAVKMKNTANIQVQLPLPLDEGVGTINITSLGTTVKQLLDAVGNNGGSYRVSYNGKVKCIMNADNI